MPKPNRGMISPSMPRSGPSMPRRGSNMPRSQFPSPATNPNAFQNQMGRHFDQLTNQLNSMELGPQFGDLSSIGRFGQGGPGQAYRPDLGPTPAGGGKKRPRNQTPIVPPDGTSPEVGPQAFGMYAPDINAKQFGSENFTKQGLKGSNLEGFGGGMFGMGMGGMGGMGGGMSMGGMDPMMMEMIRALLGQLGGSGGQGPRVGR